MYPRINLSKSSARVKNSLELTFRKNPLLGYVLVPVALAQLLLYMGSPGEGMFLVGLFAAAYLLVGMYTSEAHYKLGVPILLTLLTARFDILKQNMWEGLENMPEESDDKPEKSDDKPEKSDDTDTASDEGKEKNGPKKSDKSDKPDAEKNADDEEEATDQKTDEEPVVKEKFSNIKGSMSDSTRNLNDSLSELNSTIDKLEHSYDRIMKMGSKLGIQNQLSTLAKSVDIVGILNQKKELK